jgi:HemX protein
MDFALLTAAAGFFAAGMAASLRGLVVRGRLMGHLNLLALALGFLVLTASLYVRGTIEKSCPLNSLYDVLVFQSWSLVLIYLVVGPAYRLSLLGIFTAPLAFALLLVAMLAPLDRAPVLRTVIDPWVETHAALSIIAYGAFGLACIAGAMYLIQERQLKSHRFTALFYNLPPISELAAANRRLIGLGLVLLTVSFVSGFMSGMPVHTVKFWGSLGIWGVYGTILAMNHFWPQPAGRMALASVCVFAAALVTLPGIQFLSRAQ